MSRGWYKWMYLISSGFLFLQECRGKSYYFQSAIHMLLLSWFSVCRCLWDIRVIPLLSYPLPGKLWVALISPTFDISHAHVRKLKSLLQSHFCSQWRNKWLQNSAVLTHLMRGKQNLFIINYVNFVFMDSLRHRGLLFMKWIFSCVRKPLCDACSLNNSRTKCVHVLDLLPTQLAVLWCFIGTQARSWEKKDFSCSTPFVSLFLNSATLLQTEP